MEVQQIAQIVSRCQPLFPFLFVGGGKTGKSGLATRDKSMD